MDSCLVKHVCCIFSPLLLWYSQLDESITLTVDVLVQEFMFEKRFSQNYWPSESLQLVNKLLCFSRSKPTQKLELIMPMLMIDQEIEVYSNLVHDLNIDFFENIGKSSLVDMLLKRMQIHLKSLVFTHDGTPEIQNFVHGILLVSGQANSFFKNEGMILQ